MTIEKNATTETQIAFMKELGPILPLDIGHWNPSSLVQDMNSILKRYPFSELNQLNLTVRSENESNPYEGLGHINPRIRNGVNESELDFQFFNSDFKGSAFFEIYQALKEKSPFPLGRVRLMRLHPKSCYSIHQDGSLRFHVPIVTNPETYFCFENKGFHHLPAEGKIFCTNTLLRHTVVNGGTTERIHLVFSTSWQETSIKKIESFLSL